MLSSIQKADILVRAGIAVPTLRGHGDSMPPQWRQEVENLFAAYMAARAARSLRESEAARTHSDLRHANNRITHPSHLDDHDQN